VPLPMHALGYPGGLPMHMHGAPLQYSPGSASASMSAASPVSGGTGPARQGQGRSPREGYYPVIDPSIDDAVVAGESRSRR